MQELKDNVGSAFDLQFQLTPRMQVIKVSHGAGIMAQQVREPASKAGDLRSSPGPTWKKEN